jgi:hypothetical protein
MGLIWWVSASLVGLQMQAGNDIIDWETDPIIFKQIFRGHLRCSWVLAVVDRTLKARYCCYLFMPGYFPNTLDKFKGMACRKKPTDNRGMHASGLRQTCLRGRHE